MTLHPTIALPSLHVFTICEQLHETQGTHRFTNFVQNLWCYHNAVFFVAMSNSFHPFSFCVSFPSFPSTCVMFHLTQPDPCFQRHIFDGILEIFRRDLWRWAILILVAYEKSC